MPPPRCPPNPPFGPPLPPLNPPQLPPSPAPPPLEPALEDTSGDQGGGEGEDNTMLIIAGATVAGFIMVMALMKVWHTRRQSQVTHPMCPTTASSAAADAEAPLHPRPEPLSLDTDGEDSPGPLPAPAPGSPSSTPAPQGDRAKVAGSMDLGKRFGAALSRVSGGLVGAGDGDSYERHLEMRRSQYELSPTATSRPQAAYSPLSSNAQQSLPMPRQSPDSSPRASNPDVDEELVL